MKQRLPKPVYQSVIRTIDEGTELDPSVADVVASAMKDWAIEKGATHYAHVFYPLTGLTAEKHDSFLSPDGQGGAHRRVRRQDARSRASPTRRASRTAASAPPSRRAATPPGTSPARPTSSRTRTAPRSASRRPSCRGRARRSTRRRRSCARCRRSTSRRSACSSSSDTTKPATVVSLRRRRAGVLPDRPPLLLLAARPGRRRPHALRCAAAEGAGVRGPLLRRHPRARPRVHARVRARALQARRPGQDAPQRGGARASTRSPRSSRPPTSRPTTSSSSW